MDQRHEELLRRIAVHDEHTLGSDLGLPMTIADGSPFDARTAALVRFAGCVASGASTQSYEWSVSASFAGGASLEDIVGVLATLAPVIGSARVNAAAVDVATAIGIELGTLGRR